MGKILGINPYIVSSCMFQERQIKLARKGPKLDGSVYWMEETTTAVMDVVNVDRRRYQPCTRQSTTGGTRGKGRGNTCGGY
ncbi:hypothetical protein GOBAR_AA32360 [Gossypium barbadense]|uniref:Uncharacterized protein n=1 Tax=Gossypium barbadense TaxID=3634 RepID=A0A2P5WB62_GOSBA|nr:hypothetical protein GOBAR_AA32360 [Gossypium barbadense]